MEQSKAVYEQSKSIAAAMRRTQMFGFDRQPQLPIAPGADTAAQQLQLPADTTRK
jgi:hypothetical protein